MKAQVSSEYMVILAVVLVLAIIAAMLTSGIIGTSGSVNEQQSRGYWVVAAPLSVLGQKYSGNVFQLEIQNSLPRSVQVSQISIAGTAYSTGLTLEAGETGTFNLTLGSSCGPGGKSYSLNNIQITYQSGDIVNVQRGEMPLVGTCS